MKKILVLFSIVLLASSCIKQMEEPESAKIAGIWAVVDSDDFTSTYYEFEHGQVKKYVSWTEAFYVSDQTIWGYLDNYVKNVSTERYSLIDGTLYFGSNNWNVRVDGETMTLEDKKCRLVENFRSEYYSTINLSNPLVSFAFNGGNVEWSYTINNSVEGFALKVNTPDWVKNVRVLEDKICFTVSETSATRTGDITISYPSAEDVSLNITQNAAEINLEKASVTLDYTASSSSFTYSIPNPQPGYALSVETDADWIINVKDNGSSISFSVAENNSGSSRTGNITLVYGGVSKVFTVTQTYSASSISLTSTSGSHDYTSGTYTFKYTVSNPREGQKATFTSSDSWITSVIDSNGTVSYKVSRNTTGSSRSGKITVKYGDQSNIFTITQSAASLTLSSSSATCTYASVSKSFSITIPNRQSDLAVSVKSNVTWITGVSESSGTVSYAVAENNSGSSRTGKITVTYAGVSKEFTVTQSYSATSLSLSPTSASHDYTSNTYTFNYTVSNPREGQKATVSTSDSWITSVIDNNGTVSYTVAENNSSSSRTGTITVAYAGVNKVFSIIQMNIPEDLSVNGTANCYVVSSAGSYYFKPVKGNSSTSVGTISSVAVLWESFGTSTAPLVGDLIKSVSYMNENIYFDTATTFKEGNAVIAAKDASGKILWSWHVWLTDEPQEQEYYNEAGIMMDRNLGATSATPGDVGALGLLYQWGRKDPFLSSSSISSSIEAKSTINWPSAVSTSASVGTISYVTANPTTFVYASSFPCDWHYTSRDNTLWTTSSSSKSIYDPCPAGWRVPDGDNNGVWPKALGSSLAFDSSLYDSTNEGINFSEWFGGASIIWYPASGSRSYYDGRFNNVGQRGYWWSASPSSDDIYYLTCQYNGSVWPSSKNYRAFGYSVRCLKE